MGLIDSRSAAANGMKGLHLYHAGRSNCSARVRLLLEEKKLPWVSHHIDLQAQENLTEEYFGINPKGLVPSLVHDGRVIVESNDILVYLEQTYPAPSFTPDSAAERLTMAQWLQRSASIHVRGIKTFAYAKLDPALIQRTPQEADRYRRLQKDPELLEFHAKHDPGKSFTEADVTSAAVLLRAALREIDVKVGAHGWIVGASYSLADISWVTTMTTLERANFPLAEFPRLMQWYRSIADRPAWQRALRQWDGQQVPTERLMENGPVPRSCEVGVKSSIEPTAS